jgi:nicotinate-nucleotide adenylyltransferase
MVRLAIGDNDHLRASDIEFRLPAPSFTIDTLTYLSEKYPAHEFCLIMGEDNLYTLHKWKNVDRLVNNYAFYIYPRRESARPENPELDRILGTADIKMIDAPQMDISSTFIRNGIRAGKNMSYFVPSGVWQYISEMHFYEK